MSKSLAQSAWLEGPEGVLPEVELEVRHSGRSSTYTLNHVDFLVGTVPGCDLRVPGPDLPALLCLVARKPGGVTLRKLAPTQLLLVNGATVSQADLHDGDRVTLGAMDLYVSVRGATIQQPASERSAPVQSAPVQSAEQAGDESRQELHRQAKALRDQVARLHEERKAF